MPDATERLQWLANAETGVEVKGKTMPYLSMKGNMFAFVTAEGALALRLPEDARTLYRTNRKAKECVQHGRVMAEYLLVPNALLADDAELREMFATSLAYARTLKAKPTKKPAKKAPKAGGKARS